MARRWVSVVVGVAVLVVPFPAVGAAPAPEPPPAAEGATAWSPPVDGPIVRGFEPPRRPFGPHHAGLDFAVRPGSPVRAAGDGAVVFAGRVGRSWAVTVDHGGRRQTSYAYLGRVRVIVGWPVRRGAVLGESGGTGPGHGSGVVHFGYRVGGRSEDPAPLFRAPRPRISLAPLDRPACPGHLEERPGRPATLGANPTAPGRESTRLRSIGVRR